ncbi:hypothetical protein TNCV_3824151 [Trichonephila clavipes]|nr:hypothetical protein TNCV_3824151 [Trichonephila clavipes]
MGSCPDIEVSTDRGNIGNEVRYNLRGSGVTIRGGGARVAEVEARLKAEEEAKSVEEGRKMEEEMRLKKERLLEEEQMRHA